MRRPRVHVVTNPPVKPAEDPKGRVDILVLALAKYATQRFVQPYVPGTDVWAEIAQPVLQAKIRELGIPERPVSPIEIAERVGFLKGSKRLKDAS